MENSKKRILVLGASGMLGSSILKFFYNDKTYEVIGCLRSRKKMDYFSKNIQKHLITDLKIDDDQNLENLIRNTKPVTVINCIGLVKQLSESNDPLKIIPINSFFPQRLSEICKTNGAKLIHFSTDCVFSGLKGMYKEDDLADATDLYGVSKRLGEFYNFNSLIIRTSIIGHELEGNNSLVDWFLSQQGSVKGFKKAIFSGFPTIEICQILKDHVLNNDRLTGLYHISSDPISKFDLLNKIKAIYGKNIKIYKDEKLRIDRSLDSSKFRKETGFNPKPWTEMILNMHNSVN